MGRVVNSYWCPSMYKLEGSRGIVWTRYGIAYARAYVDELSGVTKSVWIHMSWTVKYKLSGSATERR